MVSDRTQPDLGDDLLREDVGVQIAASGEIARQESPEERVHSAEILHREGLVEEAKKILHSVLISHPQHHSARTRLKEIHDQELQQILGESPDAPRRRQPSLFQSPAGSSWIDANEVIRRLDQDLSLGLHKLSLFEDEQALQLFEAELERALEDGAPSSVQDRIDLGVGFFEMDLYASALKQWDAAERKLFMLEESGGERLSVAALRALALVLLGRPYEAGAAIQPILRDSEVSAEAKTELFYLMGRAAEAQGNLAGAVSWYAKTDEADSLYRDARERLERIRRASG